MGKDGVPAVAEKLPIKQENARRMETGVAKEGINILHSLLITQAESTMRSSQPFFQSFAGRSLNKTRIACLAVVLVCLVGLAGCGKRPGAVDAPEGSAAVVYPRVYPDLKAEPVP